uniref:Uncharacterized protein n=1 Tax=Physcomitrium patens TaxID=3218 RepID=A0A7I4C1E8_PHYPA
MHAIERVQWKLLTGSRQTIPGSSLCSSAVTSTAPNPLTNLLCSHGNACHSLVHCNAPMTLRSDHNFLEGNRGCHLFLSAFTVVMWTTFSYSRRWQ